MRKMGSRGLWAILLGVNSNFPVVVLVAFIVFFFKQKTAYEIRLSLVGSEMC